MSRDIKIVLLMVSVLVPSFCLIMALYEWSLLAYNVYMYVGMCTGVVFVAYNINGTLLANIITFTINMLAWPFTVVLAIYSNVVLKRGSVFD